MLIELIDKSLNDWVEKGLNSFPGEVPGDMVAGGSEGDWKVWLPIESKVNDAEIAEVEADLGFKLSPQYVQLLKHKHFIELRLGEVEFVSHPSRNWQTHLVRSAFHHWPREDLIDRGYFPFASYSDWGLWCFGVNEQDHEGEYPVYLWDHEADEKYEYVAANLLAALENELRR